MNQHHGTIATMTDTEIAEFLREQAVGRIGCHADGRTYIVPITYVYDAPYVYAHSVEGTKLRMMRSNPAVCFEVDDVEDLATWRSVVAHGSFAELHGAAAADVMKLLVTRFGGQATSITSGIAAQPFGRAENRDPVAFAIHLTSATGRREHGC